MTEDDRIAKRVQEVTESLRDLRGLIGLAYDRNTFFAVKHLERHGFLTYSGRDGGRILVHR